jgi:protein-S-isoprenylcysteine O-methyltransferase Ste14
METETIFRILLPSLIVGFMLHRGYYVKNHTKPDEATVKQREEGMASRLAGLLGLVGSLTMIAYVINPVWLSRVSFPLPTWLRWTGVGIAVFGFLLLQWAQNTLANSWSDTPRMMKEQTLITSVPYRWVRHPIYSAFLMILGSILLVSANWFIGLCWLGMTAIEVISRIGFEESLMIEYFGDQYRTYMKQTGRLLPRLTNH